VSDARRDQVALCQRFSVEPMFASDADKVGIAVNVRDPQQSRRTTQPWVRAVIATPLR